MLEWTEEDRSIHPQADELGADLQCTESLYKDLQVLYMNSW